MIPFNKPSFVGNELRYIQESMESGHLSGDGPFTKKCHDWLDQYLGGSNQSLLTSSCTDALEMCAQLLEHDPGDEVIIPSFTFVSTANAFYSHGFKPIFCDIRPDTLNIDENRIMECITKKTRAIVVVHYGGNSCEMEAIQRICREYSIALIEDNAHGFFGSYRGKKLGTFGHYSTLSFHETKNMTCGEGGALVVNSGGNFRRAEIIRQKGTNRNQFFRGEVDKYTWVDLGSSYLPSDLQAAFLFAQLEQSEKIQQRRETLWRRYHSELKTWAAQNGILLPQLTQDSESSYHLYHCVLPTLDARTRLIRYLRDQGILSVFHYQPLHLAPLIQEVFPKEVFDCPVSEQVSNRLTRLPLYYSLTDQEQGIIIEKLLAWSSI